MTLIPIFTYTCTFCNINYRTVVEYFLIGLIRYFCGKYIRTGRYAHKPCNFYTTNTYLIYFVICIIKNH